MAAPPPPPPPPPPPRKPERLGPRPLPLYLALEGLTFLNSCAASMILNGESPSSKPGETPRPKNPLLDLRHLDPNAPPVPAEAFSQAVKAEACTRFASFLDGVLLYRQHPYRRRLVDPPVVWQSGAVGLRDYGRGEAAEQGLPLLVVPSLINRGYVLDLMGTRSFLRTLARRGFRPFLLDWGWPGEEEHGFDLGDYVTQRMIPALEAIAALCGRPPVVIGYCMGGLMSLALCLHRPQDVAGFVALATPWNFHADRQAQRLILDGASGWLSQVAEEMGELPVDLIQALFSGLDPQSIARKFRSFGGLPQRSDKANTFVAMEDWLNDGVPLAGPVAHECLTGWYGENRPHTLRWQVAGQRIDPAALTCPSLVIIPTRDRIVPPDSSRALAVALGAAKASLEVREVPLGHIGMITGSAAGKMVYAPLIQWLRRTAKG